MVSMFMVLVVIGCLQYWANRSWKSILKFQPLFRHFYLAKGLRSSFLLLLPGVALAQFGSSRMSHFAILASCLVSYLVFAAHASPYLAIWRNRKVRTLFVAALAATVVTFGLTVPYYEVYPLITAFWIFGEQQRIGESLIQKYHAEMDVIHRKYLQLAAEQRNRGVASSSVEPQVQLPSPAIALSRVV